ncbi:histone-lysine N-methyltransferase ATXR4 isoform X1 [Trifolium pratense]|uniref:histone-lysine N-methyltransferase ATXR4 isoform X1 n=1 Tax=Trifolium pratense TaxID=57577 RepID=UPI001E697398|nr:histone-lysine N-methyltransferase ATXR4 isoform X1 [Trifolium pratense]
MALPLLLRLTSSSSLRFRKPFRLLAFTFSTTSQPNPPPIRVSLTDSVGRAVFATRPILTGDLIHTAEPAICHPSPSSLHPVCYSCLARLPNHSTVSPFCSHRCHQRSKEYYDVEMKANWTDFDNYCRDKYLNSFQRNQGLKYPFLVKRLACMIISGVARSDSIDILQPANLTPEMILEMEEEFTLLRNAFTKALIEDEQIAFLTKQWYISVLARIRINAFRIELAGGGSYEDLLSSAFASVEAEAAVGNAVYILPSFYNHDCDPNAHIIWIDSAVAKLKTLRDIDEGEELRICYIDTSMDRDARQELLFRGFGFHCNCSRCLHGD